VDGCVYTLNDDARRLARTPRFPRPFNRMDATMVFATTTTRMPTPARCGTSMSTTTMTMTMKKSKSTAVVTAAAAAGCRNVGARGTASTTGRTMRGGRERRRGATVARRGANRPPITIGERVPEDVEVRYFDEDGSLVTATMGELTRGKTTVVFAVPGAFTPTCSTKHLPGYVSRADEMRARGVDAIMCVSVNDAFVMNAWGESAGARKAGVRLLADGSAHLARAMGTDLDLSAQGMGIRSRRFAMIVRDGVVEYLAMEAGDKYETSGAEDILKRLPLA